MEKDRVFELAENYISRTGVSVFLTGRAGTGKTTFLKYIVENTPKRCVVLAPTGVAAINAGGVTIHSFFQLPLCPYLPDVKELITEYQLPEAQRQLKKEKVNIIRTLDLLIIDEISMVRADLLDAVDMVMRKYRHSSLPFGGCQVLMIGDARQLPPVVTENEAPYLRQVYASAFFFHSKVMQRLQYITIELEKVYRQSDAQFLEILNSLREGRIDKRILGLLNERLDSGFNPKDNKWIRLTTHNSQAESINTQRLSELRGNKRVFRAVIDGRFPEHALPAEMELELKEGAQVMFLRNDRYGRYYNGKIATVTELDSDEITVTDENGDVIKVTPETWENIKYEINKENNQIEPVIEGTFEQFPLRAAWAITIHKSQGLTFDRVIIDAGAAFTFGQVYVALSRCRTLEGIVLSSPISASCLYNNIDVSKFHDEFRSFDDIKSEFDGAEMEYFKSLLTECFCFGNLSRITGWIYGIFRDKLKSTYPSQCTTLSDLRVKMDELNSIGQKFGLEIKKTEQGTEYQCERARSGANYFLPQLKTVAEEIERMLSLPVDSSQVEDDLEAAGKEFRQEMSMHIECLEEISNNGFEIQSYLKTRTDSLLKTKNRLTEKKKAVDIKDLYADNRHPGLIGPLIEWRTMKYLEENVKAYQVLSQKTLLSIANECPRTKAALLNVYGFGKGKWEKYGQEILDLIECFLAES